MCLQGGFAPDASAAGNVIKVTEGRLISADLVDFPLTRVLGDLSQTLPIEIKGRPDANDRLTLHFSGLTLQEALRRIMAGYNYVVIEPGPAGGRLVITILGKAVPAAREEAVPSPPVAEPPPGAGTPAATVPAQPPTGRSVPPPPPSEGQPPMPAVNPQPGGDTGAPTPGVLPAPGDQPEFNPAAWGGRGRRR